MDFKPHFVEIKLDNKDYLYIVHYREHSSIHLVHVFNSISDTYMGIELKGFVEEVRGLLRAFPNFVEEFSFHETKKDLLAMGFVQTEPTELEIMLYKK